MTWRQWHAARHLLAEEFVGAEQRAADQMQDAKFRKSLDIVRRSGSM